MRRPGVFFDRDNTLIACDAYLGDPSKVMLVEGAADAVAKLRQYGFVVVTVSNQSGVARGYFTEADVEAVNKRMDDLLKLDNPSAVISRHEYCPFHPEGKVEKYCLDSPLRKPRPGMILSAADKLNLDLGRSWVVGDTPRDIEAGKAAGCRTILFVHPSLAASPAANEVSEAQPDFRVTSLKEAVEIIGREAFKPRDASRVPAAPPKHVVVETLPEEMEEPNDAPADIAPSAAKDDVVKPAAPAAAPLVQGPVKPATHLPSAAASDPVQPTTSSTRKLEALAEQILTELKRRETIGPEFSVSKLLAGIVQAIVVLLLFLGYTQRELPQTAGITLLFAIAAQTMTIALLIMGRQR
jgi:D-glycero-D-manno-heptose 1,7-bisphosphate phosphatase